MPLSAPLSLVPEHRLSPKLRAQLESRGVPLDCAAGESSTRRERRIDTALMLLFKEQRSREVFDLLYRRTRADLMQWIVRLCARRRILEDPLEILQDTYVNVYRYASTFREGRGQGFQGWAATIAANVARRRRSRRRREYTVLESSDGMLDPSDPRPDPGHLAQRSEEREHLRRAWTLFLLHYAQAYRQLSQRDQLALQLVEVEGLDYRELGRRLGARPSNTKMIVFRARKRLRAHMGGALRAHGGECRTGTPAMRTAV